MPSWHATAAPQCGSLRVDGPTSSPRQVTCLKKCNWLSCNPALWFHSAAVLQATARHNAQPSLPHTTASTNKLPQGTHGCSPATTLHNYKRGDEPQPPCPTQQRGLPPPTLATSPAQAALPQEHPWCHRSVRWHHLSNHTKRGHGPPTLVKGATTPTDARAAPAGARGAAVPAERVSDGAHTTGSGSTAAELPPSPPPPRHATKVGSTRSSGAAGRGA